VSENLKEDFQKKRRGKTNTKIPKRRAKVKTTAKRMQDEDKTGKIGER
jgi:hypothetical protein